VGRPDIALRSNAWALVAVLPATALLVKTLGLTGAGLSWIVYHVFSYVVALPRISAECLHMPLAECLRPGVRAGVAALAAYGTAAAVTWSSGGGVVALGLAWVLATALYAVAAFRLAGRDFQAAWQVVRGVAG
jgi:O-antigen/teichoic acid export membrane protein